MYDRFNELVAETGVSKSHIARQIDKSRYYFRDAEKTNINIRGRSLEIIAEILHTTPAYLTGESDEKSPSPIGGELTAVQRQAVDMVRGMTDAECEKLIEIFKLMQK